MGLTPSDFAKLEERAKGSSRGVTLKDFWVLGGGLVGTGIGAAILAWGQLQVLNEKQVQQGAQMTQQNVAVAQQLARIDTKLDKIGDIQEAQGKTQEVHGWRLNRLDRLGDK